jgi:hypothetical protein
MNGLLKWGYMEMYVEAFLTLDNVLRWSNKNDTRAQNSSSREEVKDLIDLRKNMGLITLARESS